MTKCFVCQILKDDINSRLTGLASSVLREKMISLILSDQFPSVEHCNIYQQERKEEGAEGAEDSELITPNCPNICCTGAFIQEGMMGVIMSAEVRAQLVSQGQLNNNNNNVLRYSQVRQLIFSSDKVQSRRQYPACLEFNVPVVLTHLLGRIITTLSPSSPLYSKLLSQEPLTARSPSWRDSSSPRTLSRKRPRRPELPESKFP